MASVYSGAGEGRYGTVQVKGMVEFGMQYNYKQCALEIHVKQCKELAAVDTKRNRSDPYVKVKFNCKSIMLMCKQSKFVNQNGSFRYTFYRTRQKVESARPKSRNTR
jgi:hypothetical protein